MASIIVLYKGRKGSGKTLTLIKDGIGYFQDGWRILRNFDLTFGEYISNDEILKLDKNSSYKNCVIMIDEIQIFFDSRRSMKKENMNFSNFIQQIRKRNIVLLACTQYANAVDLRFRQHVDIIAYPNFIKSLQVCEVTYVDITSLEDSFFNTTEPMKTIKIIYDPKPLFKIYDTTQIIR